MMAVASRTLAGGQLAEIVHDPHIKGTFQLIVDGTPQSHVNPSDPSDLWFEYVRRMGHVIDAFRPPGAPITALHLGGGAYTVPRYIEATRPGSRQQVIELDPALIELVREHIPLPKRASIRVRQGDAREKLQSLPRGLHGVVDLVVVDVFSGSTTPSHLTSVEFYASILPFLSPNAIVLVNAAGGGEQRFVRGHIAAVDHVFGETAAMAEPQVFKGRRHGNVVLIAGTGAKDHELRGFLPRALAGGPHPATLLSGTELTAFTAGVPPITDATAEAAPPPPQELFGGR